MNHHLLWTIALIWVVGCNTQPRHQTLIKHTTPTPQPPSIETIPETKEGHVTIEGLHITYHSLNGVIFSHGGDAHSGLKVMRLQFNNPTTKPIIINAQRLELSTQRCQDTQWDKATTLNPTRWTSQPEGHIQNNRITIGAQKTLHVTWHHETRQPRSGCGYGFVFAGPSEQRYRVIIPVRFEREADER